MLSTDDFPAFAAKVVPYLHVTTRLDDRPHEKLLQEKGFGGFPSLAFMDAKGEVVAQPQDRTVAAFDQTLAALEVRAALMARRAAGEEGLEVELLLVENTLGTVKPAEFEARAKACSGVTEAQQARIDQVLLDNKVTGLAGGARRGGAGLAEAAGEFRALLEAGTMPTAGSRALGAFWNTLAQWARQELDAPLARRVTQGMRKDMADNEFMVKTADQLDEAADKMDELAALRTRFEAGEEGLAADVLVLEYDLGKTTGEAFLEQAAPLMISCSETQVAALKSRARETKFQQHLALPMDPAARLKALPGLVKLLDEEGAPPENLAGAVWQVLLALGTQAEDPDVMQRALDGMNAVYGSRDGFSDYAQRIAANIQKVRDARAAAAEAEAEAAAGDDDGGAPDDANGDGSGEDEAPAGDR